MTKPVVSIPSLGPEPPPAAPPVPGAPPAKRKYRKLCVRIPGKARWLQLYGVYQLNPCEAAIIQEGVDCHVAKRMIDQGWPSRGYPPFAMMYKEELATARKLLAEQNVSGVVAQIKELEEVRSASFKRLISGLRNANEEITEGDGKPKAALELYQILDKATRLIQELKGEPGQRVDVTIHREPQDPYFGLAVMLAKDPLLLEAQLEQNPATPAPPITLPDALIAPEPEDDPTEPGVDDDEPGEDP